LSRAFEIEETELLSVASVSVSADAMAVFLKFLLTVLWELIKDCLMNEFYDTTMVIYVWINESITNLQGHNT
jgi:hypothetical protein